MNSEITFRTANESEHDVVLQFLREHFFSEEPINNAYPIRDESMEEDFILSLLPEGNIIFAIDPSSNNRIAGLASFGEITTSYAQETWELSETTTNRKWKDILKFMAHIEAKSNVCRRFGVTVALHLHGVAVDKEYRGRAIGRRLFNKCFDIAASRGLLIVSADCSSIFSIGIAQEVGMECVSRVTYDEYHEKIGERIFFPIAPHHEIKTFVKKIWKHDVNKMKKKNKSLQINSRVASPWRKFSSLSVVGGASLTIDAGRAIYVFSPFPILPASPIWLISLARKQFPHPDFVSSHKNYKRLSSSDTSNYKHVHKKWLRITLAMAEEIMFRLEIYRWRNDNLSGRLWMVMVVVAGGWRDLNYKFNLWPHLKLFSENCPAIKPTIVGSKDQKSIMIINHFNLIILYDAPAIANSAPAPLHLHPGTYFMCYYHDFSRGRIDGHLTKLLRSFHI